MRRWPIIRHARWLWASWRVHRWAALCGSVGLGLGVPNESDLRHLDMIWRGEI
jgi:hypothetical protein